MVKVIDNCVSKNKQNLIIKNILTNKFFPWFFLNDITFDKNTKQRRPAFGHLFIQNKKENSSLAKFVVSIISKYTNKDVIKCRSLLQLPLGTDKNYDTPHIDLPTPHTVYLYYVIDSDGETVFFKNSKVIKKIKPKKGRLLVFDGSLLHSAYQPKSSTRCIINFDVEK